MNKEWTKGIKATIYPSERLFKRCKVVLNETIEIDGHIVEEGSIVEPFLLFVPPEFKSVVLHSKMRREARNLKERWKADWLMVKTMGHCWIIRRVLTFMVTALHSLYRTVQLSIKDLLRIPRK